MAEKHYHGIDEQLLGVYVEAQFDSATAENRFQQLKKSQFYSRNLKIQPWFSSLITRYYPAKIVNIKSQLLGMIVESVFDIGNVRSQFSALKKTGAFDNKEQLWIEQCLFLPHYSYPLIIADTQLLAVLVMSIFRKKGALRQ